MPADPTAVPVLECASSGAGFAVFVVSAVFFGSSGFDEAVGPAAIGPETYAVMLEYGKPEADRT